MKHKIIIIFILIFILCGLIVAYLAVNSNDANVINYGEVQTNSSGEYSKNKNQKKQSTSKIKSNSEITSALVEKIEPHATYYLEEIYVEEKEFVSKGTNILKYTNGTYLTAPYDCSISELNLPEINGKLLNSHYVQISSNNVLSVSINVDETNINQVNVGQEAKINVTTLEKEYTGYITNIASTASNGKFKVTIEFENDGNIKLGMTATVELVQNNS